MRRELGGLNDDGRVDVEQRVAGLAGEPDAMLQQEDGVGTLPLRVRVGEMPAEVSQGARPEDGVGQGVGQDVGVRVAERSAFERNPDPAQDERPAYGEPVRIESVPDPECAHRSSRRARRSRMIASTTSRSRRWVTL